MKRVIAEDEPVLLAFDENRWIDRLDSQAMPVEEAVNLFAAQPALDDPHPPQVLRGRLRAASGIHTEAGRKSLADLVATAVGHVDHHLRFLYAKRATLGRRLDPPLQRRRAPPRDASPRQEPDRP